jgi:hypothetical protein
MTVDFDQIVVTFDFNQIRSREWSEFNVPREGLML